jgi:lysophospholipase L1-like esterase
MQLSAPIKNVLAGLLSLIVVLLIVEGLARVGHTVLRDINRNGPGDWFIYSPGLGWEPKPGFTGIVGDSEREFDHQGFISSDTRQISDKRTTKVVFLGDSNTFGWGVSTSSTFVEVIDTLLPNISAINLGVPGYTSYQGYQMLVERGLRVNPNIIVVSFNFNDRRYVLGGDNIDNAATFQKGYAQRTSRVNLLDHIYCYRGMSFLLRKLGIVKLASYGVNEGATVRLDSVVPRVSPDHYRENLVRMVELASKRDIYVIFVILGDNPVLTEYLRQGIRLLDDLQYGAAIESLKIAVRESNWFSDLARIYLAAAYEENGLIEERDNVLTTKVKESLGGGCPIYLDTEYSQIMREVAKEYNIEIVDAASSLSETRSDYLDVHPDENGHQKIAHLLHERLVRILKAREDVGNDQFTSSK